MSRLPTIRLATLLRLCLIPGFAHTGEAAPEAAGEPTAGSGDEGSSVIVYEAAHFSRYDVITAVDMLRRIPGVPAILDAAAQAEDVRGWGSAGGQILINGRRIPGNADALLPALERIQASLVRQINLIRGTSPDIPVRSDGIIINILLRSGADAVPSVSWRLGGAYLFDTQLEPVGAISYGGNLAQLTYLVGLDLAQPTLSRQLRSHRVFRPNGRLFESRDEIRYEHTMERSANTSLLYSLPNARELRANARLMQGEETTEEPRDRFDVTVDDERRFRTTQQRLWQDATREWEIGLDYIHPTGEGGSFNLLLIYNSDIEEVDQLQQAFDLDRQRLISLELTDAERIEAIIRGSFQTNMSASHSVEFGLERALNQLDTSFRLFHEEDGAVREVEIFNAQSLVGEVRWEAFFTHTWSISPRWSLESALIAESSTIEQTGADVGVSRSFLFFKPRFDLRHDVTPSDQLRLRVERTVSQLDFANFVSSFDFEVNQLRGGNPELEPETTWELEMAYEKRLPADSGVLTGRLYHHHVGDYVDRIALTERQSALGNLGDGTVYGAELQLSLRLFWLGLPDAIFNAAYLREKSRVTDPLTGERRIFSGTPPYDWRVGFRHDLAQPSLSYGVEVRREGPRTTHEITWHRYFDSKLELKAFFEARVWRGMTLLIEGEMLAWDEGERDQKFFEVNRGDGRLQRTEYMHRRATPKFTLTLRGHF